MDKRYQVFVSSTFEDLQDERKVVIQALLESDCIPAGMELFPASNEEQWSLIKDVINDCDYFLLIIGGRYGSTNKDGKSYTQMEYEYAKEVGKPMIAFIHKNPDAIPSGKSEKTAKGKKSLAEFKNAVKGFIVKYWENPNELAAEVVTSLHKLVKKFPAEGWVKAGSAIDESSIKEIRRLQAENRKLREELEAVCMHGPEGTADLAQGDDTIEIGYKYRKNNNENNHVSTMVFTWNQLFAAVAPLLIGDNTEFYIEQAIEELIVSTIDGKKRECSSFCWISKESLGAVLVQFKALGLIKLSDQKHRGRQENYWRLTPYGDLLMTQIVAKRKK